MLPLSLSFSKLAVLIGTSIAIRYFVIAGGAYLVFWKLAAAWSRRNSLQQKEFSNRDIARELGYSILSLVMYAIIFAIPFHHSVRPHTLVYRHVAEYGWGWWIAQIALLIVINDTYFYWMHRAVHVPALFRRVHRVHHLSTNPSPFAAFAFHPLETLLEFCWILPFFFILPLNVGATIVFSILSLIMNVIGHLGVEIYPDHWCDHPALGWLNRSTFHNDHHRLFKGNYGLYFTFWDRVMGTLDERSRPAKRVLNASASSSTIAPQAILAKPMLGSKSHL